MTQHTTCGRAPCPKRWGVRPRDDRGSTALQLAVAAPVVLLLGFLGLQVALVSYARSAASTAAAEAVDTQRAYQAYPGAGQAQGTSFLTRTKGLQPGAQVTVRVAGGTVIATVRGQALSVIPGMTFTVTRTDSAPVEQFVR